jgi:hypothetical protein
MPGHYRLEIFTVVLHPVRFAGSAQSAAIQQCFSLTTNQRTVLSATINQRNEQGVDLTVFILIHSDDALQVWHVPISL